MSKKKRPTISATKKKAWRAFSIYVRTRDCLRTTGCAAFGLCITCKKRYHFKLLQAGHFISGRNNATLLSEKGVHAQCYSCNINLRGNTLQYRREIIELYGDKFDEELERQAKKTVKITANEYLLAEKYYLDKAKELTEVDKKFMQEQSNDIFEALERWND